MRNFNSFRRSWPFPGHGNHGGTPASPARGLVLAGVLARQPPCASVPCLSSGTPGTPAHTVMRVRPALAQNSARDPSRRGPEPSLPGHAASEPCWVHVAAICSTRGLCPAEPGFVQNENRILCMFQPLSISSDEALRFPRCEFCFSVLPAGEAAGPGLQPGRGGGRRQEEAQRAPRRPASACFSHHLGT